MKKTIVIPKSIAQAHANRDLTGEHTNLRSHEPPPEAPTSSQSSPNIDKYMWNYWDEERRRPNNSKPRRRFRINGKKILRGTVTRRMQLNQKMDLFASANYDKDLEDEYPMYDEDFEDEYPMSKEELFAENAMGGRDFPKKKKRKKVNVATILDGVVVRKRRSFKIAA